MVITDRFSLYDVLVYSAAVVVLAAVLVPILHVVAVSLEPEILAGRPGRFQIIPRQVTLVAYREAFSRPDVPRALVNTAFVTAVSAVLGTAWTGMLAYSLTIRSLPGRKILAYLAIFTMVFNLGIIPRYLLLRDIGILNTLWALILPPMMWASNLIIMRAFFAAQPASLRESALIDGANEVAIFFRIVVPLATPIIATIFLFYAVTRWNSYFDAAIFVNRQEFRTIQVVLRAALIDLIGDETGASEGALLFGDNLRMAIAVISILPIVVVYPFLQKFFVKGSLIGAVKE